MFFQIFVEMELTKDNNLDKDMFRKKFNIMFTFKRRRNKFKLSDRRKEKRNKWKDEGKLEGKKRE